MRRITLVNFTGFSNPSLDLAIIKVNQIVDFPITILCSPPKGTSVMIYGYPNLLNGKSEQRQNINCKISFVREQHFELQSDSIQFTFEKSVPEAIKGLSGSGVFLEQDNKIFLLGILTHLKAPTGAYSNLCAFGFRVFGDLIGASGLTLIQNDNFTEIIRDIDLLNNVFSISYTQTSAKYYLPREIDETFNSYLGNSKNIWISGVSGVGKTFMILRNLNEQKKKPKHIDLTCSSSENIDDYFKYINNELLTQCALATPSKSENVYEAISDNLLLANLSMEELVIFVDEVPISNKNKFYSFLSGFIKISERYANLNASRNNIKWIISTRTDPAPHLREDDQIIANKAKAYKNFIFKGNIQWTREELSQLLDLLQLSLRFNVSIETREEILKVSEGLPGRLKSIIERAILEKGSISKAISLVKSEAF